MRKVIFVTNDWAVFDAMIVAIASSNKEWLQQPIKIYTAETVWATLSAWKLKDSSDQLTFVWHLRN